MSIARLATVNDIMNRAAAECGLEPVTDPFGSTDPNFIKLRYYLLTAGEELLMAHEWEFLTRSHQITTTDTDTGEYPLPDDFAYMINQTGWERSQNVPMGGPLSAQEWTYLKGRDLAENTLYASFRIADGTYNLFPSPPPSNLDINFEYITTDWLRSPAAPFTYSDEITDGGQSPLFDRTLMTRMVKVKWLEGAGFDSTRAQVDTEQMFNMLLGKDKGAQVLNAGRSYGGIRYLDGFRNTPDTGFGGVY